jgi:hypothetical protein
MVPTVAARGQATAAPAPEPIEAGRPQRRTCPHCNTMTPVGYAFCQHCGKNLPSMPEAVRAGVMVSGETSGAREQSAAPGGRAQPQPGPFPRDPAGPPYIEDYRAPVRAPEHTPPPMFPTPPPTLAPAVAATVAAAPPLMAAPTAVARRPTPPAGQPVTAPAPASRSAFDSARAAGRALPDHARTPAPFPPAGDIDRTRPAGRPGAGDLPAGTPRGVPASAPASGSAVKPAPESTAVVTWGTLVAVKPDGSDGARFPLSGNWIDVGRSQADISFVEDRFLAPRHMRLVRAGNAVRALPLDTFNGVFRQVRGPVELDDGDVVLMGQELLRFELVEEDERASMPLVRHGVALFGSPPRAPWGRLSHLIPSGGVRDVRHLYQGTFTIGREEGDWTFPDDAFLSRLHATLSWLDDCCTLEDPGSSNGTFIRLTGATEVRDGDHLRIGDHLLRLELDRDAQ